MMVLRTSAWWIGPVLAAYGWALPGIPGEPSAPPAVILVAKEASFCPSLAALELRRYIYLRTGQILPAANSPNSAEKLLLISRADHVLEWAASFLPDSGWQGALKSRIQTCGPDGYFLWTTRAGSREVLFIVGSTEAAVLWAAYRLAEHLGVRFYLEGDVIPDRRTAWAFPQLDEVRRPLFAYRGIQPFHDFPEGPDWVGPRGV